MATKIRKDQIRTEEFIKGTASVDWTSDVLTASAKAIAAKIDLSIGEAASAMQYRGEWSLAATDTIKKGYVYVYVGIGWEVIGTGSNTVTVESGDLLIAKRDNASISDASHWTVVNVNIVGAVTEENLIGNLMVVLEEGNAGITIERDEGNDVIKLTVNFPTVSNGSAVSGKYVSGLSINSSTGVITPTRADLPDKGANHTVLGEAATGSVNGSNRIFKTNSVAYSMNHSALYINGIRQQVNVDYTVSYESSSSHKLVFSIASGAYVPQSGDSVTCDYMALTAVD